MLSALISCPYTQLGRRVRKRAMRLAPGGRRRASSRRPDSTWQQMGTWTVPNPSGPSGVTLSAPANGNSNVAIPVTLSWTSSPSAASYDVYLSPTNPPALAANTLVPSFSPAGLVSGVTYYWYVVARNAAGVSSPSAT